MGASFAVMFARASVKDDEDARKFDTAYYALQDIMQDLQDAAAEEDQSDNAADTGRAVGYLGIALDILTKVRYPADRSLLKETP